MAAVAFLAALAAITTTFDRDSGDSPDPRGALPWARIIESNVVPSPTVALDLTLVQAAEASAPAAATETAPAQTQTPPPAAETPLQAPPESYAVPAGGAEPPIAAPVPPPVPTPTPPPGSLDHSFAEQLVALINAARAEAGVPAVSPHGALAAAAQAYATLHFEHADPFQLSHNLDGSLEDRLRRHGYYGAAGEALAVGPVDAQTLLDVWLASPPHRELILGAQYSEIGLGCYVGWYTDANNNHFQIALCVADLGRP